MKEKQKFAKEKAKKLEKNFKTTNSNLEDAKEVEESTKRSF